MQVQTHTQNLGARRERHKVRVACQECRDRKTRCDGGRPICNSCDRKNLPPERCVYLNTAVAPPSSYVRTLESRIKELEALHTQSSNGLIAQYDSIPPAQSPVNLGPFDRTYNQASGGPSLVREVNLGRTSSITQSLRDGSPQVEYPTHTDPRSGSGNPEADNDQTVHEESPVYLGSSSAVGFMNEVCQIFGPGGEKTSKAIDLSSSTPRPAQSFGFGRSGAGELPPGSISSDLMIPQRAVSDKLLDSYWTGAHPLQPFIHQRGFKKRYDRLWTGNDLQDHDNKSKVPATRGAERIFHCTFNTMLALGCGFWSISNPNEEAIPARTEQHFFDQAKKLLDFDLLDEPCIELVQAILLMVQFLQNQSLSNRAWVLLGNAIRTAQAAGLHLDIEGESQEQREERRRTWSLCVLLDRVQSMTFGRPLMLNTTVLCPTPQMIDEEYLSVDPAAHDAVQPSNVPAKSAFFVNVHKLSSITAEILHLSYSPVFDQSTSDEALFDYSSLFKIARDLERWHDELPSYIRYDRLDVPSDITNLFVRQANLLHHRYLHSKILLFRRVVVRLAAKCFANSSSAASSSIEQSMASSCVEVCTSAAQDLLEAIYPHIGTQLVPPAWFTVLLIYTVGTVLAVVFITPSFYDNMSSERINDLQQCWKRCIKCLGDYQKRGVLSAITCLRNLRKLYPTDTADTRHAFDVNKDTTWTVGDDSSQIDTQGFNFPNSHNAQLVEPRDQGIDPNSLWSMTTPQVWWPEEGFDSFVELAHSIH